MDSCPKSACLMNPGSGQLVGLVRTEPVDTVCPNFYVLAHAVGCAFRPQCAYCYLRDRTQYPPGTQARADLPEILAEVRKWIARDGLETYVLNTGNLSDSLCFEDARPVMAELAGVFRTEAEAKGRPHTLLLVTKGGQRHCASLAAVKPCRNVIVSFSVNCPQAVARYEAGTATTEDRLAAARQMKELGWRVRIRIDPMVQGYEYADLVEQTRQLAPERVTLGCLRADGGLVDYVVKGTLDGLMPPREPGGIWQYPRPVRLGLYRPVVEALRGVCSLGLCEEWPDVWDELGLPRKDQSCNCNHL